MCSNLDNYSKTTLCISALFGMYGLVLNNIKYEETLPINENGITYDVMFVSSLET